jgi:hypothetical protein
MISLTNFGFDQVRKFKKFILLTKIFYRIFEQIDHFWQKNAMRLKIVSTKWDLVIEVI